MRPVGERGSAAPRPKRTRVAKPPQERLEDLLAAALATYRDRGIADATVTEITERAGVAKGTFYLYFESKQHALAMLWQRYVDGLLVIADATLDPTAPDPAVRLAAFLAQMVDYALAHADLHRIVYRSADATALNLCRDINQQVVSRAAAAVRRGVEAGRLQADDPELTARILYHGAHETLHDAIYGQVPLDRDHLIDVFRSTMIRALGISTTGEPRPDPA